MPINNSSESNRDNRENSVSMHRHFQHGYTLIEMIVVLAVLAVLSHMGNKAIQKRTTDKGIEKSVEHTEEAIKGIRRYRSKNGTWPSSITQVVNANLLDPKYKKSYHDTHYNLSTSAYGRIKLFFNVKDTYKAAMIAGDLPYGKSQTSFVTTEFPPASQDAGLEETMALDGSRKWTGRQDVNGQSLDNVNTIGAIEINARRSNFGSVDSDSVNANSIRAHHKLDFKKANGKEIEAEKATTQVNYVLKQFASYGDSYLLGKTTLQGEVKAQGKMRVFGDTHLNKLNASNIEATHLSSHFLNITNSNAVGGGCSKNTYMPDRVSGKLMYCKNGKYALENSGSTMFASSIGNSGWVDRDNDLDYRWGESPMRNARYTMGLYKPFASRCVHVEAYYANPIPGNAYEASLAAGCISKSKIWVQTAENKIQTVAWKAYGY